MELNCDFILGKHQHGYFHVARHQRTSSAELLQETYCVTTGAFRGMIGENP